MKKKGKKITLDDLAAMVAEGFSGTATKDDIKDMATKSDIARLELGQEEIKLRLDNVAYRFELVDLQKRVTRLEEKAGMAK